MRMIAAILIMMLMPAHLLADNTQAIILNPLDQNKMSITNVINIYGKCGNAVVAILGVEADGYNDKSFFKFDAAGNSDIQLRKGGNDISYKYTLSDYNVVHCVQTKNGERLLIGSSCSGSVCPDEKSFYIIEPQTGKAFPNKKSKKTCDTKCANRILGFKYL